MAIPHIINEPYLMTLSAREDDSMPRAELLRLAPRAWQVRLVEPVNGDYQAWSKSSGESRFSNHFRMFNLVEAEDTGDQKPVHEFGNVQNAASAEEAFTAFEPQRFRVTDNESNICMFYIFDAKWSDNSGGLTIMLEPV